MIKKIIFISPWPAACWALLPANRFPKTCGKPSALQSAFLIKGDPTILFAKAVLDLFSTVIFASTMGYLIAMLFLPQAAVYTCLILLAPLLYPVLSGPVYGDFSATTGIISLVAGFNLLRIKEVKVMNFLPALLLIFPVSSLWINLFS